METDTPAAPRRRPRGGLVLEHSPFHRGVLVRAVLAGVVIALVTAAVGWPLTAASPLEAEVASLTRLNVGDDPLLVRGARLLSWLGHALVVGALAAVVAVVARLRWHSWDLGLLLAVVLGGATVVTGVIKLLTARARPGDALVATVSSAYPSGHAVRALALYGLIAWLAVLATRRPVVRVVVAFLAVIASVVSALARVALAAHWPTDVVVGTVVGTVWLVVSLHLLRPRVSAPTLTDDA